MCQAVHASAVRLVLQGFASALISLLHAASSAQEPAPRGARPTAPTQLSFSLAQRSTTSAGVYSPQGRLLRTLWRGETMAAGRHEGVWDQRDDQGRTLPDGEYGFRLIHHRVGYVWEGVVGNSSGRFTGPSVHKSFLPPTGIAISAGRAYYAVGYNEGQPGIHGFDLSAPALATQPLPLTRDAFVAHAMVAADETTRLYWANIGGLSKTSFVGAYELGSGERGHFAAGQPICLNRRPHSTACYEDQAYSSVIDVHTDPSDAPTGLAVQHNGRVLAVAHGARNLIRLFDKGTGQALGEITVPLTAKAVNQIAMSRSGALLALSGRSVLRVTGLERQPSVSVLVTGLSKPLAIAAAPGNEDRFWVADGGSSQQLKLFGPDGQPGAVIGRAGGAVREPAVRSDTLCFRAGDGREQSAVGAAPNGSVWVVDTCNNRMLRFTKNSATNWVSDAQVAYLPASYAATVDQGNPRRVFANFLEFEVDDAGPLMPAGRSWRLLRNWLAGLPAALTDEHAANAGFGGFTTVQTLANGRTYGLLRAQGRQNLVELPASGPLRVVKVFAQPAAHGTAKVLYENGDLGYAMTGAATQSAMRLPLIGFDSAGDPVWSVEPVRQATVPTLPGSPYYRGAFSGMPPRFPVTGSGKVVFFDQSVQGNEGFHLGAASLGATEWLWQASPSGALDGKGSFQTKAVDGSINYGGNSVWAHGRHIVYGYHGEFHKDLQNGKVGQANQFMHFDESGLFVGQFGLPSTRATMPAEAGLGGNAFSPTLVRDGKHLYLYHNDESSHGGVHRWRIEGWDSIGELRGQGSAGTAIVLR